MAFFEIKDPNYNSEQIEAEIITSLNSRKIPFEQEKKRFEEYHLKTAGKYRSHLPWTPYKIYFDNLPRWVLRIYYENRHPACFMQRWTKQIKRDLVDVTIKNHALDSLEPMVQLEYLLYDRFILMRQVENIEKEYNERKNNIEKFHKTFSWRITIPFRFLKKFFTKMIQEIHNGIF